jgi:hypothetical protein
VKHNTAADGVMLVIIKHTTLLLTGDINLLRKICFIIFSAGLKFHSTSHGLLSLIIHSNLFLLQCFLVLVSLNTKTWRR